MENPIDFNSKKWEKKINIPGWIEFQRARLIQDLLDDPNPVSHLFKDLEDE